MSMPCRIAGTGRSVTVSEDPFNLRQFANQLVQTAPGLRDYFQQEADRTAHVPAVLDVPVRVVPPPVTIKGDLKFIATFPSDLIYGRPYDQVVQMIMDAFQSAGLEPNPLLPELRIHSLQAWREEVGRPDSDRTTSGAERTVPTTGGIFDFGPDPNQQYQDEREYFHAQRDHTSERGDRLAAAAAANAIPGLHPDSSGGVEEHGADPPAGDGNDPAERG
jgi:hypothetical protein